MIRITTFIISFLILTQANAIQSNQDGIVANLIETDVREFGDKNRVVTRREARFVRSDDGKVRIDFADHIQIIDPTTSTSYSLDRQARTFLEVNPSDSISEFIARDEGSDSALSERLASIPTSTRPAKVMDLGSRIVNGVECNGQRISNEVPVGVVGNQESFWVEAEIWKTDEFGEPLTVLMIVRNPLSGVTRHELQNIRRSVVTDDQFTPSKAYRRINPSR